MVERWPPIYDAASLATTIESFVEASDFSSFYDRYQTSRAFYVPPWKREVEGHCHVADLLRPVTAEKGVFDEVARVEARMARSGWILLHSCLVRFLCRDDGRFD